MTSITIFQITVGMKMIEKVLIIIMYSICYSETTKSNQC